MVLSNSMAPTLQKGDRVFTDQRPHYKPQVGDVIVFEEPDRPGQLLTKRVAAVAGQSVQLVDGYLCVDDKIWETSGDAKKVSPRADLFFEQRSLEEGEIFVLGDNWGNSEDSLVFGPIAVGTVKGRLWYIYWPPGRMGRVR